jgi:hypothetical protein
MNLDRHRPEPAWLYRARTALWDARHGGASGTLLDWLSVAAIGVWFGFLLSGALCLKH